MHHECSLELLSPSGAGPAPADGWKEPDCHCKPHKLLATVPAFRVSGNKFFQKDFRTENLGQLWKLSP